MESKSSSRGPIPYGDDMVDPSPAPSMIAQGYRELRLGGGELQNEDDTTRSDFVNQQQCFRQDSLWTTDDRNDALYGETTGKPVDEIRIPYPSSLYNATWDGGDSSSSATCQLPDNLGHVQTTKIRNGSCPKQCMSMGLLVSAALLIGTTFSAIFVFLKANGKPMDVSPINNQTEFAVSTTNTPFPSGRLIRSPTSQFFPPPAAPSPSTQATPTSFLSVATEPSPSNPSAKLRTSEPSVSAFPKWSQRGQDIAKGQGDFSSWSIALSEDGTTVAVGAWAANDSAGIARVYRWNQIEWHQLGADLAGENAGDLFGWSISICGDGNTVAVGAKQNNGQGDTIHKSGHVRVFHWSGSNWSQLGDDIDGKAALESMGSSVSLSSDGLSVAIGAEGGTMSGIVVGIARVYRYNGMEWTQVGSTIHGRNSWDNLGSSVSLSANGEIVAVGVPGSAERTGHVEVYALQGDNWIQFGADIVGIAIGVESGTSVSLDSSGKGLAIGSPGVGEASDYAGQVSVHMWTGFGWLQLGDPIDGLAAGDACGTSVSLSADGTVLAVSSPGSDLSGQDSGKTRIFQWLPNENGDHWVQVANNIEGGTALISSGLSVALSGDGTAVAVGAISGWHNLFSNQGFTRVYSLD
jgi:hypothetical protein